MAAVRLGDLHAALGGDAAAELVGPADLVIGRIGTLEAADAATIGFIASARYEAQLDRSAAGCVIVPPALRERAAARGAALVTAKPYLYYARLTRWWVARHAPALPPGVHASAVVADDAQLGAGVTVAAQAVIESGARIGAGAVIGAHCFIGRGVELGDGARLAPRVTLLPGTRIGARVILHSGVVIGADGFGFAPDAGGWEKIEQLGGVRIGDDVEVGANTCIDRGALDDTVIGNGVKLDNLIQIAHNVQIGEHTAMAGCAAVAGSTRIGKRCTIAGAARIIGHLELADDVHISVASVVTRSIRKPGTYSGIFPLDDNASWEKNAATLRQLHTLRERLRALEKKTP